MKTKCWNIIVKDNCVEDTCGLSKPPSIVYAILIEAIQNCSPYSQEFIEINQRTAPSILHTVRAYPEATSISFGKMLHDTTTAEVMGTAKARRAFGKPEVKISIPSFNANT